MASEYSTVNDDRLRQIMYVINLKQFSPLYYLLFGCHDWDWKGKIVLYILTKQM